MSLTNADPKYWAPVPQVLSYVSSQIEQGASVLEVGPGHAPFDRATASVDFQGETGAEPRYRCDLSSEPLPFPDKSFDFIYCRHVLEDMHNPFLLIQEMSRVGKAGYIETPSPIAELCRGIDGGSPPYRGYHHHRFILWVQDGELRLVSKYPLIELLRSDKLDEATGAMLRGGARYWNTQFLWSGAIPYRHLQNSLDFLLPNDYGPLLSEACKAARRSCDEFWSRIEGRAAA